MMWQRPTGEARNLLQDQPACIDLHHPSLARLQVQLCPADGDGISQEAAVGTGGMDCLPFPLHASCETPQAAATD